MSTSSIIPSTTTAQEEINFCFPVPSVLESKRVQLTPFDPSKHATLFIEQSLLYPEIYNHVPFGPYKDEDDFIQNFFNVNFHANPTFLLFSIWDKTKVPAHPEFSGALAGLIGLIKSSPGHLSTEVGPVIILPPFQRTHVNSNAMGLLLQYTLNLPIRQPGALGLRRVVWFADAMNEASVRAAERMHFKREGLLRWDRVMPANKADLVGVGNGKKLREGDPRSGCMGMDTVLLSLCWDDWEDGVRDKVEDIMNRGL